MIPSLTPDEIFFVTKEVVESRMASGETDDYFLDKNFNCFLFESCSYKHSESTTFIYILQSYWLPMDLLQNVWLVFVKLVKD